MQTLIESYGLDYTSWTYGVIAGAVWTTVFAVVAWCVIYLCIRASSSRRRRKWDARSARRRLSRRSATRG